jgi:hypothetical protein
MRAAESGIRLSSADAAIVKGMLARGDRQHDIAAWFGVNGGRIGEIATGRAHKNVTAAPKEKLPPSGPYLAGRDAHAAMFALEEASRTINAALSLIRERAEMTTIVPEDTIARAETP